MMWRKGTLPHCWCGCKVVQPLWKTVGSFLENLKRELPYDPAIPFLGISGKDENSKRYTLPSVYSSTIHNSPEIEAT